MGICLIVGSLLLFSFFGGHNNAINRIFEFDLLFNRKYEYLYARYIFTKTIIRTWTGGKNYAYIDFSLIQFDDV